MTVAQLQRFLAQEKLSDQWWVAIQGDVQETYENLANISDILASRPDAQITVLHVSKTQDPAAEWVLVEPEAKVNYQPKVKLAGAKTDTARIMEMIETLTERVDQVQLSLTVLSKRISSLEDSFRVIRDLKTMFEEIITMDRLREDFNKQREFIEASERQLLAKTLEHDVSVAELEQLIEDRKRNTA